MKTSIGRAKYLLYVILLTAGLMGWLVLPQIPPGQAITSAHVSSLKLSSQNPSGSGLDAARESALQQLYSQLNAGAPFSEEETYVLRRFGGGYVVSELEADILISRALYELYIKGNQLTTQQQELLDRYKPFVAKRGRAIADYKKQLLDQRRAAAATAPPQATPQSVPPNDLCSGAETIQAAGPFPFTTGVTANITDATTADDPPLSSCSTDVSRSIWYKFTPSKTAVYVISACSSETATTVEDTVMAIYTSSNGTCAGSFTVIPTSGLSNGCNDDSSSCSTNSTQSIITTQLNADTTYFIVVWLFGADPPLVGMTAVQLAVTQSSPSNDSCATPVALALNTSVFGSTSFAINDYQLPAASPCFTGIGQTASTATGRDVVYSFTAPSADNYSFRANFFTGQDAVLYVASNCPEGTPPLIPTCLGASNRNSGTLNAAEEVLCLPLAANQTVFVFVDEANLDTTEGSIFRIEVTKCSGETESNNTPATANTLTCGIEGSISPGGDFDFYSLGTPAAGSRVFSLVDGAAANDGGFDMRITTSTATIEFDDGNNDVPFGSLSSNVAGTPLTGVPAFIRVNHSGATTQSQPYRLYAAVQPPGVGPGSSSATTETEPNNTIAVANSAANNYFYGTLSGPAPSTDLDVFSFTAAAGDVVFLSLDGDPLRDNTPIDPRLELLDSSGSVLISVNDGSSTSSTTASPGTLTGTTPFSPAEGLIFRVATAGTYYARVRIGTASAGTTGAGDYLLSISVNCNPGPPACTLTCSATVPANATTGTPVQFTGSATASNCAGSPVFDWDFGDGTQHSSQQSPQHTYLSTGTKPWSLTVTINGASPCIHSGSISVTTSIGTDTAGLYDPAHAAFFLRNSNTGGVADISFTFGPGGLGWIPIVGDWDGNGVATIGLYDPAHAAFFLRNSNSGGIADISFTFGPAGLGWIPIVGDWNGDGTDTIGLYDPAHAAFFLRNSNTGGVADISFTFGPAGLGWIPIVGDWDGNGVATIGLYDPVHAAFFLRNSNTGGVADISFTFGPGGLGWKPIVGDWNGDGTDTIGLYDPAHAAFFLRNLNTGGVADISFTFGPGGLGWIPIAGDWDGL